MPYLANVTRRKGDPKIISTGQSSLKPADRMVRNLGWFSLALGAAEIAFAPRVNAALGLRRSSSLPVIFGLREIMQGMLCLSVEKRVGAWSRVAGDTLDIAVLMNALDRRNPKRENVKLALASLFAVTAVDVAVAASLRPARATRARQNYQNRSGFPQGLQSARSQQGQVSSEKGSTVFAGEHSKQPRQPFAQI
ncbi:MAG: hypothetical protein ACXWVS_02570 [Hyphomicrobium sp.]|jgi:hypothetical protein